MRLKWSTLLLVCAMLFTICWQQCKPKPSYKNPHVLIRSEAGDIELEVYPEKAPKSVAAFLSFVDSGFYDGGSFYRILSLDNQVTGSGGTELIQGGVWGTGKKRDYLQGIPHETTKQTGILHTHGTVSLARLAPGTATTEFFICIGDQPGFDYGSRLGDGQGYAAFGRVVNGMNTVMKMYRRPETKQYFDPPIRIREMRRL